MPNEKLGLPRVTSGVGPSLRGSAPGDINATTTDIYGNVPQGILQGILSECVKMIEAVADRDGRLSMALEPEALIALRRRVEALCASPCGMVHESVPAGPDGDPVRSTRSPSGFARTGLCPEAGRAANLACSHTMARYVLRDAIMQVPGEGDEAVVAALHELEQAISLLDHRRYDAESRRASARLAEADDAPGEREIAALVAEHRACVMRADELRDDVLRRLDDALGAARAYPSN